MIFFVATPALAAEPALTDVLHERAEALVGKSPFFGVAAAIVDGEKTHTVFAGHTSLGQPAPDENTLFEIGSITKTFTGILLADAIVRGEVKLDQPVAELLGPDAVVPKFDDRSIRLIDLATQTSGLPRLPDNMGVLINPLNPYANYTADDLNKFLAGYKLDRAPGEKYEYSNLCFGLLGYALAKRAGKSYEELLKSRICEPLRMSDTTISLSDEQKSRLATGVSIIGLPTTNWDFDALAGCGAIRSTLHDMLIYLRANLAPDERELGKAIVLSHEPRFTIRKASRRISSKLEIGLAWHITTEGENCVIWHNGMTGGYAAFLAVVPNKKWGVVVLGNQATGDIDEFGNNLLKDMLAGKLPSEAPSAVNSSNSQN